MNGTDLLAQFRENRSEEAFRELVVRYTNLVFSAAKRRVSNAFLAEDITQLVFIRLAKAAPKLSTDAALAAWLHRTTVHASIDLWRSEIRRRNRENYAVAMQTDPNETVPWNDLAPVLDDAVNELADDDREAIVLRFFADKSMRDVGETLGVSEDAAKMRVSRALGRLRHLVSARGVRCGALALAAALAKNSIEAAPAHLAATLAALKIPAATGGGVTAGMLAGGVAALLFVGAAIFFFRPSTPKTIAQGALAGTQVNASASAAAATEADSASATSKDPDPLQLLQAVARARERITSGTFDFYSFMENTHWGPRNTNYMRFSATFDGPKLRFESLGREYAYVGIGKEGEASAAKMKELGLDNEGGVAAGLLTPFEARNVIVRDGSLVLHYREGSGERGSTAIHDPTNHESAALHFDPRSLGLTWWLKPDRSPESCLAYKNAETVKLVGKELVEGTLAWHINVQTKHGWSPHFWLEVDEPTRVIKHVSESDVVLSKYHGKNPIPIEVTSRSSKSSRTIVQTNAQFNVAVEPTTFALEGLGMKVGSSVSDIRNHRGLGYWTGSGLESSISGKTNFAPRPKLSDLVQLLESNPTSGFALESAIWIMRNTPDGPEVEKAADVIMQEHIESPELFELCKDQDRVRHRSSKKLLQALLDKNPSANIKAMACLNLATLAKEQAKFGVNKEAAAEADKLFSRVIRDFPKFNQVHNAKCELEELRRMAIGNPAPPMEGTDLDGNRLSLNDYRGKVVLVYFWGRYYDHPDDHHKLVQAMAGKPFALIGVNDDEKPATAKAVVEKHEITWPSFWDGVYWKGPIHSNWYVRKWPSTYILDQNGVIRYRDLRWFKELEEAVNSLLP